MATRSFVGIENEDGTIEAVYVHYDGYPSARAPILLKGYNTEKKLRRFLKLGNCSIIHEKIGKKHKFDRQYDEPSYEGCTFYGRDRGETDQQSVHYDSRTEFLEECTEDYTYLFSVTGKKWLYRTWNDSNLLELKNFEKQ